MPGSAALAVESTVPAATVRVDAAQRQHLGIRVVAVAPATALPIASLPALVVPPPNARVAVAAPFAGVVLQTYVVAGQSVARGERLATVVSREVLSLGAELEQARARLGVARSAAIRTGRLVAEGIAAGARADEARAALREAEVGVATKARILARAHADAASGDYTLLAPIAGRVSTAAIQTGAAISGMSAPFVIDAAQQYAIEAQLPERLIGQVLPGTRVALGGGVFGTVTAVGATIDPQTRSASLKASVPAAPGIVAGRAISVQLLGTPPKGAVAVPAGALVRLDGRPVVFTEAAGGFIPRPVAIAGSGGGLTAVTGLPAGTRIAVSGTSELKALAGAH